MVFVHKALLLDSHAVVARKRYFTELPQWTVDLVYPVFNVLAPFQNHLHIHGLVLLAAQIEQTSQQPDRLLHDILSVIGQTVVVVEEIT